MKRAHEVLENKFDINNKKSLARLQKRARFSYVNKYQGKEGKKYQAVFSHPTFQKFLDKLNHQPLDVAEIAILGKNGFGVLAMEDIHIKKGGRDRALGVYWGKLVREGSEDSPYVFSISKNEIDARKCGNWTRFVNHSKGNYNVVAKQKTFVCGKHRLPYIEYALIKSVKAGEQLLVDYGPNYEFDKKHQIFLNPSNGFLSARDVYTLHHDAYKLLKGSIDTACRELMPDAVRLYGPAQFITLLTDGKITDVKSKKSYSAELPILRADKRGTIVADKKQSGLTALMLAAYMGNEKAVKALIKSLHANIEQQNTMNGYTALFYAVQSKCTPAKQERIVKQLVDAGIQLEIQDKEGHTALHWCVANSNLRLLKLLFSDRKSKSNAIEALDIHDREHFDPVTYALAKGELTIAAYLMKIFEKEYNAGIFHKRHNEWLLPVIKKIIAKTDRDSLLTLASFLVKNGFDTNRDAFSVLVRGLKKKGIRV